MGVSTDASSAVGVGSAVAAATTAVDVGGDGFSPAGASAAQPVPAMVILPGSGGISPGREEEYAKLLNRHGIAAFIVEYYEPRGMTSDFSYMLRSGSVTEFDIVTDAYSALKLLSTSPAIDPKRIGLVGHSEGGIIAPMVATPCV